MNWHSDQDLPERNLSLLNQTCFMKQKPITYLQEVM